MVIDSNIFIEYLRAKDKHKTVLYSLSNHKPLYISAVSLYELYMGAITVEKKKDVQLLTEDLTVLPFDEHVANQASEIYHQLKKENLVIEFQDIFIGATCIVFDQPLITTNNKHLKRIQGLRFV